MAKSPRGLARLLGLFPERLFPTCGQIAAWSKRGSWEGGGEMGEGGRREAGEERGVARRQKGGDGLEGRARLACGGWGLEHKIET